MSLINSDMIGIKSESGNTMTLSEFLKDGSSGGSIPISLFGESVSSSSISKAIDFIMSKGGGSVTIPPTDSNNSLKISVGRNKIGALINRFEYQSYRHPMGEEARPYTGESWEVGDIVYNSDFENSDDKCVGWVCTESGIPGKWMKYGEDILDYINVLDFSGSFNDLLDKPFYPSPFNVSWDGVKGSFVEALSSDVTIGDISGQVSYYRVSEGYATDDIVIGADVSVVSGESETRHSVTQDNVFHADGKLTGSFYVSFEDLNRIPLVFCIQKPMTFIKTLENDVLFSITFDMPGTYLINFHDIYVSYLYKDGKKISENFIPNTIQRKLECPQLGVGVCDNNDGYIYNYTGAKITQNISEKTFEINVNRFTIPIFMKVKLDSTDGIINLKVVTEIDSSGNVISYESISLEYGSLSNGKIYSLMAIKQNDGTWNGDIVEGIVGRDLTGNMVNPTSDSSVLAGVGAEVFNDYREREFNSSTVTQGNVASGDYSHAEGGKTTARGNYSHAEGESTKASGICSHAEGYSTTASRNYSHAEGYSTTVRGSCSHSEGSETTASGDYSHAEGKSTTSGGDYSHAEGKSTSASGHYSHAEGGSTIASGNNSHSEGSGTTASGIYSHAEGLRTTAQEETSHAEGYSSVMAASVMAVNDDGEITSTSVVETNSINQIINAWNSLSSDEKFSLSKKKSHSEGSNCLALGSASHAEGFENVARGDGSHAEGSLNFASNANSHAEGSSSIAGGLASHSEGSSLTMGVCGHSEGYLTKSYGYATHSEGSGTRAGIQNSPLTCKGAHAEGYNTTAYGDGSHSEGYSSSVASDMIEALSKDTTVESIINTWNNLSSDEKFSLARDGSHCEGKNCLALGLASHAEGLETKATGNYAVSQGTYTSALGDYSYATGSDSIANGTLSYTAGGATFANGMYSYAEGFATKAMGICSHSGGCNTIANDYQFVTGKYNVEKTGASGTGDQSANNTIFMVGNGTSKSRSNAFRITADGTCRGTSAFVASGADFAEYFEWLDGNPNNEDRRGKFVTLVGDKIRIANADDDYILGAVSGTGAFIGNSSSEDWQGKYLKDVFGEPLTQQVEVPEKTDEKTGEVIPAHTVTQFVLNPDYDPSKEYISREFRKEWSPIGFHGQVIVVDDGTCEPNGYCKVNDNGTATSVTDDDYSLWQSFWLNLKPSNFIMKLFKRIFFKRIGYRVMCRIDDSHIKVFIG